MTPAQRKVDKRITRAIMEYKLIAPGDRVLIAVSGGKDSLALVWNLARKRGGFPIPFEIEALHVDTGFGAPGLIDSLKRLLKEWEVNLTVVSHPAESSAANSTGGAAGVYTRKGKEDETASNCWRCARERRRILFEYAAAEGFNKVALGHHMDDSLATLLMNMTWNAQLAAMPPVVPAGEGSPSIIRPLILLQEADLIRLAVQERWPFDACLCPRAGDSRRDAAEAVLKQLTGGSPERSLNLWTSLSNIKSDLLPPRRTAERR